MIYGKGYYNNIVKQFTIYTSFEHLIFFLILLVNRKFVLYFQLELNTSFQITLVKRELVDAFGASMRLSVDIKSADGADPDAVTTLAEGLDLEADADEEMVRAGWTADVSRTKLVNDLHDRLANYHLYSQEK